jgi:hypothetical protein
MNIIAQQKGSVTMKSRKFLLIASLLLALDQINYSGTVTISGNTAYGIKDRFLRMAGAGDATVIIKDNTVTAYKGADADFIKVTTDSTTLHNYTGSNNQCFK